MLNTGSGCVELNSGICANEIAGVTFYDPFYNVGNTPPWDLSSTQSVDNPTGIIGSFVNFDANVAQDTLDGYADGSTLFALPQSKMLHSLSIVPGPDGILHTTDDRVVSIGGGISYFPNYGDEPATISCEVIVLP